MNPTDKFFASHQMLKAALQIRGTSLVQLSRDLGVSAAALTLVGQGKMRSATIEKAMAEAAGTTPEKLWPGRD